MLTPKRLFHRFLVLALVVPFSQGSVPIIFNACRFSPSLGFFFIGYTKNFFHQQKKRQLEVVPFASQSILLPL
jgi:hypothetical protein